MTKTIITMNLAVLAEVVGNLLLKKGMGEIGDLSVLTRNSFLPFAVQIFSNPKIWLGIACLAIFFGLWLTVLSWEDLSVALPLQAASFIITPIMGLFYLGEAVPLIRWVGIFLVSIGVLLVTARPSGPKVNKEVKL